MTGPADPCIRWTITFMTEKSNSELAVEKSIRADTIPLSDELGRSAYLQDHPDFFQSPWQSY